MVGEAGEEMERGKEWMQRYALAAKKLEPRVLLSPDQDRD